MRDHKKNRRWPLGHVQASFRQASQPVRTKASATQYRSPLPFRSGRPALIAKKAAVEVADAQRLAELLAGVSLEISRKSGENDQLFGSVTSADVADALAARGYTIDKRKIQLAEPIKSIGHFEVPIKLHREVTASVKLAVKKEE